MQLHDRFLAGYAQRQLRIDRKSLSEEEQTKLSSACELLMNVLDACKQKIREEKDFLTKALYEDSTSGQT